MPATLVAEVRGACPVIFSPLRTIYHVVFVSLSSSSFKCVQCTKTSTRSGCATPSCGYADATHGSGVFNSSPLFLLVLSSAITRGRIPLSFFLPLSWLETPVRFFSRDVGDQLFPPSISLLEIPWRVVPILGFLLLFAVVRRTPPVTFFPTAMQLSLESNDLVRELPQVSPKSLASSRLVQCDTSSHNHFVFFASSSPSSFYSPHVMSSSPDPVFFFLVISSSSRPSASPWPIIALDSGLILMVFLFFEFERFSCTVSWALHQIAPLRALVRRNHLWETVNVV